MSFSFPAFSFMRPHLSTAELASAPPTPVPSFDDQELGDFDADETEETDGDDDPDDIGDDTSSE